MTVIYNGGFIFTLKLQAHSRSRSLIQSAYFASKLEPEDDTLSSVSEDSLGHLANKNEDKYKGMVADNNGWLYGIPDMDMDK
eukprot:scaffold98426_cov70-Attheya_sp.AAC.8